MIERLLPLHILYSDVSQKSLQPLREPREKVRGRVSRQEVQEDFSKGKITLTIVVFATFIVIDIAHFCAVELSESPKKRNQRILYQYLALAQKHFIAISRLHPFP